MSTPAETLGSALGHVHGPAPRRAVARWKADAVFMAVSIVLCLVVAPRFYGWLLTSLHQPVVTVAIVMHVFANGCANLLVGVGSWSGRGRLDERLGRSLNAVLASHGLLALVVVLTHSAYSNIVMLAAVAVSVVYGLASAVAAHLTTRTRIAAVGPAESALEHLPPHVERISDPDVDLSGFDLILTGSADQLAPEWTRAISRAMIAGKPIRHCAEYLEEARGLVSIEHFEIDQLPAGGVGSYQTGKRLFDLALAVVAIPIAAPILLVAALAVLVTMGRPVLFVQSRVGLGGRVFQVIKLRTMTQPAPASDGEANVPGHPAPRVTAVGRLLRRLRIDELPQLWNVLIGEMSFIGPRPEWTVLAESYTAQLPVYAYRHLVRPGITGWAQVRSGYAADLQETRLKVAYDLFYLKHFSFALDLRVLLHTVVTLVTTRGAR